jgi:hypothetical protein
MNHTETMWAIKHIGNNRFYYGTYSTRQEAIRDHVKALGRPWKESYRRGCRAVRVSVTEQGHEAFYLVTIYGPEEFEPFRLFRSERRAKAYVDGLFKNKRKSKKKSFGIAVVEFNQNSVRTCYRRGVYWDGKEYQITDSLVEISGKYMEDDYGVRGVKFGLDLK